MPISTTILSHKYFNQFTNNADFLANTGDFTENLAGSSIEAIKVVTQIEISWSAEASQSNNWTFTKNTDTDWTIVRNSGSFVTDGFWVGAYCRFFGNAIFVDGAVNLTIDSISNDGRTINVTGDAPTLITSGESSTFALLPIASDASNLLTSLIYGFGIIGENETYNKLSKVSGNKQEFYFTPISGVDVAGKAKGMYNDWVSGSSTCKSIASADAYTQAFEISHIFRIEPHYLDGDLDNLQNNVLPDLFNTNSLKYAFDVEFRIALSNPNKAIKATYDSIKGSVGWFNQNFNGFDNDYQIDSIVYEDSALTTSTEGLQLSSRTKATITVSKLSGAITATQRAGVFVSYLPNQSEYQNTVTTLDDNFILDSLYHNEGDAGEVGTGVIKSLDSSIVSGNLVIVAEFEYTTAQQLRLTTDSNYLLVVQIADSALSAGNSDRVNLIADVQSYQKGAFIEGLFDVTAFNYLVNGESLIDTGSISIPEIWNEDSISVKGSFDLDLAKDAFLERIEFALVAFNTVTNTYFLLDSYFISTSGAIISDGSQQINISQSRGYTQVYESDTFNTIDIAIGAKVGDLQGYTFNFAQKLKWQDWLFNTDADTIFFNSAEPQNNLNFQSSNYSGLNDYEIKMIVLANTTGIDDLGREGIGRDTYTGGNVTVKDYGVSDVTYTVATIATLDPDTLTDLNGAVLSDRPTLLESRFSEGTATNLLEKTILHRYEKTNQLGDVLPEIQATLSLDGNTVVGQTLLSNSLFESGNAYNFTARYFNVFVDVFLEFTTIHNIATDGNFEMDIITADASVGTWTLPDSTEITTNSLNTALGGFDGTEKTVQLRIADFGQIIDFRSKLDNDKGSRITNTLDLSLLTGLNGGLDLRGNDLTGLVFDTTQSKTITDFSILNNDFSTAYDINLFTAQIVHSGQISISNIDLNRFTAGTGSSSLISATIASLSTASVKELDLSHIQVTGELDINSLVTTTHKLDTLIFSNLANSGTVLNCRTTSLTALDFALCPFNTYLLRRNIFATSITLGTAPHSLAELEGIQSTAVTTINLGGAILDTTSTFINFRNVGLSELIIDTLYNDLASAYDGVSSLSGLTINTELNTPPSDAGSLTARNTLTGAGATILF